MVNFFSAMAVVMDRGACYTEVSSCNNVGLTMKKGILLSFVCAALLLSGCAKTESQVVYAMNTVMEFTVHGSDPAAVIGEMTERVNELEGLLSRTRAESEVSALNDAQGADTEVSFEVWSLLSQAREAAEATSGAFDPTIAPVVSAWGFGEEAYRVPGETELEQLLGTVGYSGITLGEGQGTYLAALRPEQSIDLGGIAKGYASDCMADIFLDYDIDHGCVNMGGNVMAWGTKEDGSPWRVGVKDPGNTGSLCGVLELESAYAVTSGGYERYFEEGGKTYHHIIDPATGRPAESDLLSVTIVMDWKAEKLNGKCGNGTICDALSTALFVMGEAEALEFWRGGTYDFEMILVTADGRVLATPGAAAVFQPTEGSGYAYETVS